MQHSQQGSDSIGASAAPALVHRPLVEPERDAWLDLVAAAFDHPHARDPELRAAVADERDYVLDQVIVAVDGDGALRGSAGAKAAEVSIAGRWLPIGRLGTVCADPERRRQGIGRGVVAAAEERVADRGAILLNPAQDDYVRVFYEQLGYVAAMRTRPHARVACRRLPVDDGDTVREAEPRDVAALDAIYLAHYGPQTGTLRRTAEWWLRRVERRPMLWSSLTPRLRVVERDGETVAYMVTVDDLLRVWEWAALPGAETEAVALLAAAGHEADVAGPPARLNEAAGEPVLDIAIGPGDALWPTLRPWRPLDLTPGPGPVMMRAANLEVLVPFLSEHVQAAGGELEGDAHDATVRAGRSVLRCDWSRLLALAYDGRVLEGWAAAGEVRMEGSPRGRRALAAVLPPRAAGRRATDAY